MEKFWTFVEYATYDIRGIEIPDTNTANPWQYQIMALIWISAQYIYWKHIFLTWK
jgi:hypothetical protein